MLDALEASGLSAEVFAAEHGMAPQRISYWRRRLERGAAPRGFVRAKLSTDAPSAGPSAGPTLEAILPSGRALRVTGPWTRESIELWLSALEAHGC